MKYVTLQGGGVWESVTVCDRGGDKDHVTSHCQFFTIMEGKIDWKWSTIYYHYFTRAPIISRDSH